MGFFHDNSKNIGLLVLIAATIALSIALGVTLSKENQPKSSSGTNNNNENTNNKVDGNASGPPGGAAGDRGVDFTGPTRAATFDIDLTSTELKCPDLEGTSQPFTVTQLSNPAAVALAKSTGDGMLCTLVRIYNPSGDGIRENTFLQPIGRSYGGNDWEVTRGKFTAETTFTCSDTSCTIDLNKIEAKDGGGTYQLTTFMDPAQYTKKDIVARFLEQTTFGPTQSDINALDAAEGGDRNSLKNSAALSTWIADQYDITKNPIMSHRAIYRQHLNARFEEPNPLGRNSLPCEVGARYRRMTFTEKDKDKKLEMVTDGSTKLFKVDGKVRTAVVPPLYYLNDEAITDLWWADGQYRICDVKYDQYEGLSIVKLKHPDHKQCIELVVKGSDGFFYSNAPIQVHTGANDVVLTIPAASAALIDTEYAANHGEAAPPRDKAQATAIILAEYYI